MGRRLSAAGTFYVLCAVSHTANWRRISFEVLPKGFFTMFRMTGISEGTQVKSKILLGYSGEDGRENKTTGWLNRREVGNLSNRDAGRL